MQTDQTIQSSTVQLTYILSPEEEEQAIAQYEETQMMLLRNSLTKDILKPRVQNIKMDRGEVLRKANGLKHQAILLAEKHEKDAELKIQQWNEVVKEWNAERMYKHLYEESLKKGVKFTYRECENKEAVTALCFFLANDPRFETHCGFSFEKGILLRGKYGVGKTHMIKCLSNNKLQPIYLTSTYDAKLEVLENGCYPLNLDRMTYIDDVGTEETPVKYYGVNINWFKEFIETAYNDEKDFSKIIFTTNLSLKELGEKYGMRVADRISQKFNIVDIKGTSKRFENY
jgi:DNA replication protein DnaC